MKRIAGFVALLVAVIACPVARGDAAADEWKKLAGTWKVEKATFNGDDSTALFNGTVLTLEDGKFKVAFAGMNDVGTLTLDPDKKPKQMTIVGTDGPSKGKTMPAIYEIDGDMLKICFAEPDKERPTEFSSKANSGWTLAVQKKQK